MSQVTSDLRSRSFSRILLVKPSSLGDVVHALPVLRGLRHRYPQAKIDWLIATPFAPLIDGHPDLDEVVPFDRVRFGSVGRSGAVTAEFVRFVRELRGRRYDLCVDLQGLFRTGFLAWATGAAVRVGLRSSREGAWLFYTHRTHTGDRNMHAVDRNYAVGTLLGFDTLPVSFPLPLRNTDREEVAALLSSSGIGASDRLVMVAPGARWETKVWPPDRFASAADRLGERGLGCVLIGSAEEASLCAQIADMCAHRPLDLGGRTPVRLLPALMERAALVLAHDSAIVHLAVALRRPVVCIVGPTNALRTGPYNRPKDVVRLDLECAPCYFRRLSQCPHEHRCMRELSVEVVAAAADQAVGSGAAQR